ncbi:MAG: hypothetical protein IKI58_11445 [Oscillospiraceae bacterium]|nr:hypothetical protein [Oscillospiraceae bacterium]
MQDVSQPLSGADVLENVTHFFAKKTNACLIWMIVLLSLNLCIILAGLFSGMDSDSAAVMCICFSVLFGIIVFCVMIAALVARRRESKSDQHTVFRRYGGPQGVAAAVNAAYGQVVFSNKYFMLTPTFIMKPNDFTTFIPNTHLLLACKEDRRGQIAATLFLGVLFSIAIYGNKPAGLFLSAYTCYGDQVDYLFKGKSAQVDYVCRMIQPYAPQCAIGDSPETRLYLATHKIMPPV